MYGGISKMENLNKLLNNYKVTELKEIAKNSGIKGYSKLKKAELIDVIITQLADTDVSELNLPDEIKNSINANAETVAANIVSTLKSDDNTESDENTSDSDDGIIRFKNRIFGVAPLVANVIPKDMPLPPSNTPDSFMQIKKIYPNDKCPCGSGKKYKKCCGKTA